MPTGNHGCIYERWQRERTDNAYRLIARLVPLELHPAARSALAEAGIIDEDDLSDAWEVDEQEGRGFLDG